MQQETVRQRSSLSPVWAKVTATHKYCSSCEQMVPLADFRVSRRGRGGRQVNCKKCQSAYQSANKAKTKARRDRYYARHPERQVYRHIQRRNRKGIMSQQEFSDWYTAQERICVYCDVDEPRAIQFTGHRLNVDRKDGALGYTPGNCCLACQCCNLVKSGYLTFSEMKQVGQLYMRPKWQTFFGVISEVNAYDTLAARVERLEAERALIMAVKARHDERASVYNFTSCGCDYCAALGESK